MCTRSSGENDVPRDDANHRDEETLIVLLCTAPDSETGERLARGLVEARLAACVKVIGGVKAFYRWEGQIEEGSEVQLLIKSRRALYAAIDAWVHEHHPYDVPELVSLPAIDAGAPYAAWTVDETR